MINWKVRIKNKSFWLAFIPAVLLLAQAIAEAFGYRKILQHFHPGWYRIKEP